jgi:hypothetical protein
MHMRFYALLLATTTACGSSNQAPSNPPISHAQPASSSPALDSLPIAQYLGADDATGDRVFELMRAAGIKSSAGGSLGYSVWVDGTDRAKARQTLLAAASNECLAVTIFDDQGQSIPNTQPARCTPPAAPAPASPSKK